jgi:hypothetical protein
VYKASVYRVIVLATVLFSLLSFANAEQFSLSSLEEVTHYAAGDDFIGSRSSEDDSSYVPVYASYHFTPAAHPLVVPGVVTAVVTPCYTLHDIRGPPAV